ncbi:hypothetical protein A9Q84_01570 [Halobacteriovorax marinus]|uniref:Solute-binding protein family 3/N-terminal domain-containing protein n=1 Tax=Halobacteriovorax marinus TaxID=97084 RepID=A0A1Y5FCJ1_9BACT|nr:hypothetical protein A9Q84_01570 [Halobacteriovorax marinus]
MRIAYTHLVASRGQFYVEELKDIYERIGISVESLNLPSPRGIYYFETNRVDALGIRIGSYDKFNPDAIKVNVPIFDKVGIREWVLKEDLERVSKNKKNFVVSIRGDIAPKAYSKRMKIKVNHYSLDIQTALQMLKKKRADVLILTDIAVKVSGLYKILVPLNDRVLQDKLYHFIHKSKAHLLSQLEIEFRKSKKEGKFSLEVKK